jgi:hypothetical protein
VCYVKKTYIRAIRALFHVYFLLDTGSIMGFSQRLLVEY